MNDKHPLPGEALLVPVGSSRHTSQPYYPAQVVMDAYLRASDANDGHVLYPISNIGVKRRETAGRIILWSQKTGRTLTGVIADSGSPYNPQSWDRNDPYQAPRPWDGLPAKTWLKVDGLCETEGFDPALYVTTRRGETMTLPDALASMKNLAMWRITPA